jgi:hypothetical protein
MSASTKPRRTHRRRLVVTVLLIATALALPSVAGADTTGGLPEAGVGTAAAKNSPSCGPDGRLAIPASARPSCTRPLKKGESNGGVTTKGVTATTIKIVLFFINHEQQAALFDAPNAAPAIDRATGEHGYLDQSYRDWEAVFAHSYNTWGRKFEFVYMNPTAPDETAQRADAFRVAQEKPFAVIAPFAGEVFAADLVAKKIVVFVGSVFRSLTNTAAAKQAPYRWGDALDPTGSAVNAAQFAARQLKGETAKWSGDFVTKSRVFGALHPATGIDWQYFESTAKKEGLQVAQTVAYTMGLDPSAQNQEEAPTLVAKLRDSAVTTVLLFADFSMEQQVFKAADELDYHPEWVFTGYQADDADFLARVLNDESPDQMKHVFGIGSVPPYVAGPADAGLFDWYWGPQRGVYTYLPESTLTMLHLGISFAGPRLTPERFRQALFSLPAGGGAASNQVETFMAGLGRSTGLPYDEYSPAGIDFTIMWWNPQEVGKAKGVLTDGVGRFMYIDGAKRYHAGQWKKGEPKLFDSTNSISQFDAMPKSDVAPEYSCRGCPSTR